MILFFFFTNPNPSFRAPYRWRLGVVQHPCGKDSHNPRVYGFVQQWILLNKSGSIVILSGHKKFDLFSMLSLAHLTHIYNHILSWRNRDTKKITQWKKAKFRYPAVCLRHFRFLIYPKLAKLLEYGNRRLSLWSDFWLLTVACPKFWAVGNCEEQNFSIRQVKWGAASALTKLSFRLYFPPKFQKARFSE